MNSMIDSQVLHGQSLYGVPEGDVGLLQNLRLHHVPAQDASRWLVSHR